MLVFMFFPLLHACSDPAKGNDKVEGGAAIENADTTIRILTSGLPDFERENSRDVIAAKWGISFYSVAGCMVTAELMDSVDIHNDSTCKLIVQKYGDDWSTKFDQEVDAEYERQTIVKSILDTVDLINHSVARTSGLQYHMTPMDSSADYHVSVEGLGKIDEKGAWVSYYRMKVNYETKTCILFSDTIKDRR
jgi:hypothetical protein